MYARIVESVQLVKLHGWRKAYLGFSSSLKAVGMSPMPPYPKRAAIVVRALHLLQKLLDVDSQHRR